MQGLQAADVGEYSKRACLNPELQTHASRDRPVRITCYILAPAQGNPSVALCK